MPMNTCQACKKCYSIDISLVFSSLSPSCNACRYIILYSLACRRPLDQGHLCICTCRSIELHSQVQVTHQCSETWIHPAEASQYSPPPPVCINFNVAPCARGHCVWNKLKREQRRTVSRLVKFLKFGTNYDLHDRIGSYGKKLRISCTHVGYIRSHCGILVFS